MNDEVCDIWQNRRGNIRIEDMPENYIHNIMRYVGIKSPWYKRFQEELRRRKVVSLE